MDNSTELTAGQIAELALRTMEAIVADEQIARPRVLANHAFVAMLEARLRATGGEGSGNFGHAGRPGEVGGSAPSGGASSGGAGADTVAVENSAGPYGTAKGLSADDVATIGKSHDSYTRLNPKGADTQQMYRDPVTKVYTPERRALHEAIVRNFFQGKTPVPVEDRVATVLGGGPASGKSTLEEEQGISKGNVVLINPDQIKDLIPEMRQGIDLGAETLATGVHEESADIAKMITEQATKGGFSLVLDGTGDGEIDNLEKKITQMREGGGRVIGKYVSLPTDLAVQLAKGRGDRQAAAGKIPRYVPEDYQRGAHRDVSNTFVEALKRDLFDTVDLYDTTIEKNMRPVLSKRRGEEAVIHNEELWETFKAKGKETWVSKEKKS